MEAQLTSTNATTCVVPRMIVCWLENYQIEDMSFGIMRDELAGWSEGLGTEIEVPVLKEMEKGKKIYERRARGQRWFQVM